MCRSLCRSLRRTFFLFSALCSRAFYSTAFRRVSALFRILFSALGLCHALFFRFFLTRAVSIFFRVGSRFLIFRKGFPTDGILRYGIRGCFRRIIKNLLKTIFTKDLSVFFYFAFLYALPIPVVSDSGEACCHHGKRSNCGNAQLFCACCHEFP